MPPGHNYKSHILLFNFEDFLEMFVVETVDQVKTLIAVNLAGLMFQSSPYPHFVISQRFIADIQFTSW